MKATATTAKANDDDDNRCCGESDGDGDGGDGGGDGGGGGGSGGGDDDDDDKDDEDDGDDDRFAHVVLLPPGAKPPRPCRRPAVKRHLRTQRAKAGDFKLHRRADVRVGPQIGMNPKPILGLPDLEY